MRCVDESPGRSEVGSSSQPAVHSNQFPGPYYRHKCRVHKGGTESDLTLKKLKNSSLASDEKMLNTRARLV